MYTDANKNEVSEIFEVEDIYCVVVMTEVIEEGTSDLEDVRFRVERAVFNEKKANSIITRLNELAGTMEEVANEFGSGADYNTTSGLKENTSSIANLGSAPEALGLIFSMEPGQRTKPVQTASGVAIFDVVVLNKSPEIADYAIYRNQILTTRNGRVSYYTSEAIKDAAKIKDERYLFY